MAICVYEKVVPPLPALVPGGHVVSLMPCQLPGVAPSPAHTRLRFTRQQSFSHHPLGSEHALTQQQRNKDA